MFGYALRFTLASNVYLILRSLCGSYASWFFHIANTVVVRVFVLDTALGSVDLEIQQWDDDEDLNGETDQIDMTEGGGDSVFVTLDLVHFSWVGQNGDFCEGPLDAFGGCTAGKTRGPNEDFAEDDDGGIEWTITFSVCGIPLTDTDANGIADQWEQNGVDTDCNGTPDVDFCNNPWVDDDGDGFPNHWEQNGVDIDCDGVGDEDVCGVPWIDSDGDGLLDGWETNGVDVDCDGSIGVPLNTYGADPNHKDIFIEYDVCNNDVIHRSEVQNVKRAFAAAPITAGTNPPAYPGGQPRLNLPQNPDGLPGINIWIDTGSLVDPLASEGPPSCADGIDNDGNGQFDSTDPACFAGSLWEGFGPCNDGIDNDNDTLTDLGADPDCVTIDSIEGSPPCGDNVDNDGDGQTDGDDDDCLVGDNLGGGNIVQCNALVPGGVASLAWDNCDRTINPNNICIADSQRSGTCQITGVACSIDGGFFTQIKPNNFDPDRKWVFRYGLKHPPADGTAREDGGPPNSCSDGVDNNPLVVPNGPDALDPVCAAASEDGIANACHNGIDDQADNLIDSADPDCQAGQENNQGAGTCSDGIENGDGPDQLDPECSTMREDGSTVANSCWDGIDQSNPFNLPLWMVPGADGVMDSLNPDCQTVTVEDPPFAGDCHDGIDNMLDGLFDCADPGCRTRPEQEDGATPLAGGQTTCCDLIDNSADGADQQDPECNSVSEDGAGAGSCYDGLDNSTDGIDAQDDDCHFSGGWGGGDNFIIFNFDPRGGTLMHEIGHTLGLFHGGNVSNNRKPNYISVMNYDHQGGIEQWPGIAVEGDLTLLAEDGAGPGTCSDGINNGGNDGIDLLDPDCQTCNDGVDNDADGYVDNQDPDCLGLYSTADGRPDQRLLDYSPPRYPGGRATLLPPIVENGGLNETSAFISIDPNGDGTQDIAADPINIFYYRPYLSQAPEGFLAGPTCSDGIDNNGDTFEDIFDPVCNDTPRFARVFDDIDWNSDGDTVDVGVRANVDFSSGDIENRFLTGVDEDGVGGGCNNNIDDDGDFLVDLDDPNCQHNSFDDWTHIALKNWDRGTIPAKFIDPYKDPTIEQLDNAKYLARSADLILEMIADSIGTDASGKVSLSVEIENITGTPAYGPVRLIFTGLPDSTVIVTANSQCRKEGASTVCMVGWIMAYQTWTIDLQFEAHPCDWISANRIHARVEHVGFEPTPEDNQDEVVIETGGVWPMWKMCASRWGEAPYPGPRTKSLAWQRYFDIPLRSSALIDDDGIIYISREDGLLNAVNSNGDVLWTTSVFSLFKEASPALSPTGDIIVATENGRVKALSKSDGSEQWSWWGGASIIASPAVTGDGRIYVTTLTGWPVSNALVALNAAGDELWKLENIAPIYQSPALDEEGNIYIVTEKILFNSYIIAVDPNGSTIWEHAISDEVHSSPSVRGGRIYVGTDGGYISALDSSTGVLLWSYQIPCGFFEDCDVSSSPTVLDNGRILFGSENGKIYALDDQGSSAVAVWEYETDAKITASPIVSSNGVVFIGSHDTHLYALDVNTGEELWNENTWGPIRSTVSLDAEGRVYAGSDDGRLRVFNGP
jgi:outer membrane protein assembly factor BamB